MKKVAIIGAGIAGSRLAKLLNAKGFEVKLYEKARGAGGRCSSRRFEDIKIDHGAQYIKPKSELFKEYCFEQEQLGHLAFWDSCRLVNYDLQSKAKSSKELKDCYVAVPSMNQLCKANLAGIECHYGARIKNVQEGKCLDLITDSGEIIKGFDIVISTAPPLQSKDIFASFTDFTKQFSEISFNAQFALMMATKQPLNFDFEILELSNSKIAQITCNSLKPQRKSSINSIVLHSSFAWTQENIEQGPSRIEAALKAELFQITGFQDGKALYSSVHRWLYSRPSQALEQEFLWGANKQIGICADWCLGDDIESAYISATKLAESIIQSI